MDSIPKGINMRNFNSLLTEGKVYMKAFLGAKSTQLNNYVRPNEFQHDAAIFMSESMPFYGHRVKMI